MYTGRAPFQQATKIDFHYKYFCNNQHEKFWKIFQRKQKKDYFSDDFKNLINALFAFNPSERPSMAELKAHPWYNKPCATSQ